MARKARKHEETYTHVIYMFHWLGASLFGLARGTSKQDTKNVAQLTHENCTDKILILIQTQRKESNMVWSAIMEKPKNLLHNTEIYA